MQLSAEPMGRRRLIWSLLDNPRPVKSRQGSRGKQTRAPAGQARHRLKLVMTLRWCVSFHCMGNQQFVQGLNVLIPEAAFTRTKLTKSLRVPPERSDVCCNLVSQSEHHSLGKELMNLPTMSMIVRSFSQASFPKFPNKRSASVTITMSSSSITII